jgi:hypothetical protein
VTDTWTICNTDPGCASQATGVWTATWSPMHYCCDRHNPARGPGPLPPGFTFRTLDIPSCPAVPHTTGHLGVFPGPGPLPRPADITTAT